MFYSLRVLPTMPHRSGVVYAAACNCGRRQCSREDPFTVAEANHAFYAEVEQECCGDLEHVDLPVYQNASTAGAVR